MAGLLEGLSDVVVSSDVGAIPSAAIMPLAVKLSANNSAIGLDFFVVDNTEAISAVLVSGSLLLALEVSRDALAASGLFSSAEAASSANAAVA
jgi:hypothetical protein